jgi:heavy metal sensor kinase
MGVSENALRDEFGQMVGALALGLPAALVLVGVTGYFVAMRALHPLDSMARRAKQINAEHLNERLVIENLDDELGHLGIAFNETLGRLEHSFGQLKQFTADASHELRTPLTAIRSVGEVALQNGGDTRYHRDVIGSMLEEVYRLTHLVDSLLILSRADSGHLPLERSEVRLLDLATESAVLLEVLAEEKKQSLEIEGDQSLTVVGDPLILRQALVAIIHNAVKYSPTRGHIRVRVGASNGDALVEIHDDGPGIPPEHRAKVFERFYRVDKARTRDDGGGGLGLSIAEWAVRAHGGQIELECDPEPGCTFRIRLPRDYS